MRAPPRFLTSAVRGGRGERQTFWPAEDAETETARAELRNEQPDDLGSMPTVGARVSVMAVVNDDDIAG